jgi:hypothetical protein
MLGRSRPLNPGFGSHRDTFAPDDREHRAVFRASGLSDYELQSGARAIRGAYAPGSRQLRSLPTASESLVLRTSFGKC